MFLPNVPGATFIPGTTFIPESRVDKNSLEGLEQGRTFPMFIHSFLTFAKAVVQNRIWWV